MHSVHSHIPVCGFHQQAPGFTSCPSGVSRSWWHSAPHVGHSIAAPWGMVVGSGVGVIVSPFTTGPRRPGHPRQVHPASATGGHDALRAGVHRLPESTRTPTSSTCRRTLPGACADPGRTTAPASCRIRHRRQNPSGSKQAPLGLRPPDWRPRERQPLTFATLPPKGRLAPPEHRSRSCLHVCQSIIGKAERLRACSRPGARLRDAPIPLAWLQPIRI